MKRPGRKQGSTGKVTSALPAAAVDLLAAADLLYRDGEKFKAAILVNRVYALLDAIVLQRSKPGTRR